MTFITRRDLLQSTLAAATVGMAGPSRLLASGRLLNPTGLATVDDLETPAYTIDLDLLEKNIRDMQNHCNQIGIRFRAHTKSHQTPQIAMMQMHAGAVGICSQKLAQAEVMVAHGVRENILIPYNIVGPQKVQRLSRLTHEASPTVAVDSEFTAKGISEQLNRDGRRVRVIVEMDTGAGRAGVQSPQAALALAQKISKMPAIDLVGVMTYPSNVRGKPFMEETIALFKAAGLSLEVISGGGTGNEQASKDILCNEHRAGSYAFEGMKRINDDTNPPNPVTCPARLVMTVVSTPTPERLIIDGGQKCFQRNPVIPYGYIIEAPDAKIKDLSVEHGVVDVSASSRKFKVGDRLQVIPRHGEITLNMHNTSYAVRKGHIEAVWPVASRGFYT